MAEYKQLKFYYGTELAERLGLLIMENHAAFDVDSFVKCIDETVDDLELKARERAFADILHEMLELSYSEKIDVFLKILGPENPETKNMFNTYYYITPFTTYVGLYGLRTLRKREDQEALALIAHAKRDK